jgi:hypothetical protein
MLVTLANVYVTMERFTILMGKSSINIYKLPFSIAMLVYQRVFCVAGF